MGGQRKGGVNEGSGSGEATEEKSRPGSEITLANKIIAKRGKEDKVSIWGTSFSKHRVGKKRPTTDSRLKLSFQRSYGPSLGKRVVCGGKVRKKKGMGNGSKKRTLGLREGNLSRRARKEKRGGITDSVRSISRKREQNARRIQH